MERNQELVSRLKFIGKIKKDEKINTRYIYKQPNTYATIFSRMIYSQDNRGNTLTFCKDVIYRSFDLLQSFTTPDKEMLHKQLVKDIQASIEGFNNLKHTYSLDTKFCCDIDTIIEDIESRLGSTRLK